MYKVEKKLPSSWNQSRPNTHSFTMNQKYIRFSREEPVFPTLNGLELTRNTMLWSLIFLVQVWKISSTTAIESSL
nr:hypothetical protein Iba_chr12aCG17190 [Ipomoea batatas]GMD64150.1 hypothetical protein Iba_chr12bCG21680 [Ipomoea batatas]GMD66882.1 hypothetical protein Iba_chr12cCG19280 [Ipomoea batatas]GMD69057.1 hypothetical protein Iba_chr12dCG15260 [Ipomoea batatas]GMD71125.1 hypothetical protein Iba_chr12eCG12950 [Ipomoea batatas]